MPFSDVQQLFARSVRYFIARLQRLRSQPSWITRAATMAFVIVIAIPIILLVMFALLVGVFVFAVLAALNLLLTRISPRLPRRDGRENVRVIRRLDE